MKIKVVEKSNFRTVTYERDIDKVSKYKGVSVKSSRNKPYVVKLIYKNINLHCFTSSSEEKAAIAYDYIATKIHPGITELNSSAYPDLLNFTLTPEEKLSLDLRYEYLISKLNSEHTKELIRIKKLIEERNKKERDKRLLKKKKLKKAEQLKRKKQKDMHKLSKLPDRNTLQQLLLNELEYKTIRQKLSISWLTLKEAMKHYKLEKPHLVEIAIRNFDSEVLKDLHTFFSNNTTKDIARKINLTSGPINNYRKINNLPNYNREAICPNCNTEFTTNKKERVYCSELCEADAGNKRRRRNSLKKKICHKCNINVPEKGCRVCIPCKSKRKEPKVIVEYTKTCITCSKEFNTIRKGNKKCSKTCKILKQYTKICDICSKSFITNFKRTNSCSPECKQLLKKRNMLRWSEEPANKERKRIAGNLYKRFHRKNKTREYLIKRELHQIRRSLKIEKSKRNNIADIKLRLSLFGDGICCFCNCYKPIGPDRTIEHLLPVTSGGDNSCNNLYNSCRDCNESKWHHEWKSWYRDQPFYSQSREKEIEKFNNVDWKNYMITSGIHYF